ncbi:TIM barrel protein [Microbispora siamensis]|uniref:Hydroxypyruvate isomerase n=1 Tax=Microbispora siamensis TaxID=564413 RepID=A0ABQ4GSV3_9ACTN|nr:TIM barrel protein [Microbispora siamensis]GIH64507.1 hydroxypyruvate isomerase [Microbispora siamensis]
MYQLSPNIELLFTEAGSDAADRVRAAAAAGFDAVEMWGTSDKDVKSLADALTETGVALTSLLAEPRTNFTLPGTDLGPFFEGLDRAVENARLLGCPRVVLGSGIGFPGAKRPQNLQKLVEVFSQAVERTRGSGVKLVLEPVNTRVDHPGALLDRTADAVLVARGVDSDSFGILYDLYHSVTEGEDPAKELANAAGLVDYVQIADAPGRGEPGSGAIDWPRHLSVLRAAGYNGPIGLEYFPTVPSAESLAYIRSAAAGA